MIVVPGNSGCTVEILEKDGVHRVKKSTFSKKYTRRLEHQAKKQKEYKEYLDRIDHLFTPEIYSLDSGESSFSFLMEYIKYLDCITFLSNSGKKEIDYFLLKILQFIRLEISNCKDRDVMDVFEAKYRDTISGVKSQGVFKNSEIKKIDKKILSSDTMVVPVGMCHGDLTFSNMLVSRDSKNICLIDFLDNFVETPLQDMSKIRQDTKFLWTSNIFPGSIDRIRNEIVMNYLDEEFNKAFSGYEFYRKEYNRFQILNILRIFRYTSDIETLKYLKKCILSMV